MALEDMVGKEVFQSHMCKLFEDVISGDRWDEERLKFGYSNWMENRSISSPTQQGIGQRSLRRVHVGNKALRQKSCCEAAT
jgi:hypothetical protein